MEVFVRDLDALCASRIDPSRVQSYLEQTEILPSALEPFLYFREGRYTRNLVHKTAAVEILVLCWDVGQHAPVHGHEGEHCWARVERGRLRFTGYRVESEDPLRVIVTGPPVDGGVGFLDGPADIHAVENTAEFGARAATSHVYCRPYGECDIYDLERHARRRVRLSYDTVNGAPVS